MIGRCVVALSVVLGLAAPPVEVATRSFEGPLAVPDTTPASPAPVASPEPPAPVPSPEKARWNRDVTVAVGLAPTAPGSKEERELLARLELAAGASPAPKTQVRRLRPGVGSPAEVCRDGRDDLVIMVGYVPERPAPVLLSHDCRLDLPLEVRSAAAASERGLVGALWSEHDARVREGFEERRRRWIGPRARAGIIAGVALVVVGVALGAVLASALRKEKVVLTVGP